MELPPEDVLRAVVSRCAGLVASRGDEIGERALVLPNGDFFPDRFDADEPSVARLVQRMQGYAGLADVPLGVRVVAADGAEPAKACSSGSCSAPAISATGEIPRLVEERDGWIMQIPEAEIAHAVPLTTNVARALGAVFLLETAEDGTASSDPDIDAELAATALGFGALLLAGSYIYHKSCGGPQIAKVTRLATVELALACALFSKRAGHRVGPALRELEATQRAALEEADAWVSSNPHLVDALRDAPSRLAKGDFEVRESRPWLLRVLGRSPKRHTSAPTALAALSDPNASLDEIEALALGTASPRAAARKAADPKKDELRALVDDAFSAADAE